MAKKKIKRKNRRKPNMSLPPTYFRNIAKSEIMIYNGRVYQLKQVDSDRDTNIIKLDGNKYGFEESETLLDLEALYNTDFAEEIDKQKTIFLNEKLVDRTDTFIKHKIRSINRIRSDVEKNEALLLIIEKIIPEIEGKNPLKYVKEYAEKLPKEEIRKFKEYTSEMEKTLRDEKLDKLEIKGVLIEELAKAIVINNRNKSILGRYIFHDFNLVILSQTKMFIFSTKKSDDIVNINENKYYLCDYKEYQSVDHIEQAYLDILEHVFNVEALEKADKTIDDLEQLYKQEALLNQIIKGEEFHGTNGGFYRHPEGKFVFYVKFPQFINKFSEDEYVLFPAGQIAIGARYDKKKGDFIIIKDSITVLSRYRHPFTDPFGSGADESNFCIGTYSFHQKMKGYEQIPQTLVELKTLLTSGYNPYLRNNIYSHDYNYMTRAEAKRKGVQITNEKIIVSKTLQRKYEDDLEVE